MAAANRDSSHAASTQGENMPITQYCHRHRLDFFVLIAITASFLAFTCAILLLLRRSFIIEHLLLPLALALYSPELIFKHDPVNFLNGFLTHVIPFSFLLSSLLFIYPLLWRYFSLHLAGALVRSPSHSSKAISIFEIFCVLLAFLIAVPLRLHSLNRGLGYDELLTTVFFVDVESIWMTISSYIGFTNHIAYSILARLSTHLFGFSEWALRLPALLLGLASLYCAWIFARRLIGLEVALLIIFFLALSPAHVEWSISARGYSGMVLFTILSSYFYIKLLDYPLQRYAVGYVLSSAIGIYFHLYSLFVIIVQALHLLYFSSAQVRRCRFNYKFSRESFRLIWFSFAAIVLLSFLSYLPALPRMVYYLEIRRHGFFQVDFPLQVIALLAGHVSIPLAVILFLLCMLGVISILLSHPRESGYFILLFLVPILISWLLRPMDLYPRFFAYVIPYYGLFLAAGFLRIFSLARIFQNRTACYAIYSLLSIIAVIVIGSWSIRSWNEILDERIRDAASAVANEFTSPTALCVIGRYGWDKELQYYTKMPLLTLGSLEEFEKLLEVYSEVRCILSPEGVSQNKELSEFLLKRAKAQRFGYLILFTYEKESALGKGRVRQLSLDGAQRLP
jgi:uncharacterized membrane protein